MHFTKNVLNKRKYLILSMPGTIVSLGLCHSWNERLAVILCYIGITFSMYLLMRSVQNAITDRIAGSSGEDSKKSLVVNLILKGPLIAFSLLIGVLLMGSRVIIPALNYIMQIFAFSLSLENRGGKAEN